MKVNTISANCTNNNNVQFAGRRFVHKDLNMIVDHGITQKSVNIIKSIGELIENNWQQIRKRGNPLETPLYRTADAKGNFVTIRPVYQQYQQFVLMEVEKGKTIDRVLIDRSKPCNFTYERAFVTPYGSASGKNYNSSLDTQDKTINQRVNSYIETFGRKILAEAE